MNQPLAKPPRAGARRPESFLRLLPDTPALVYALDLDAAAPLSTLLPLLTHEERARAGRFATPLLAARFAARRWGLRLAAAGALRTDPRRVSLSWDSRGRPMLLDSSLFLSASSAGPLGLVAVAHFPVGVDALQSRDAPAAAEALRSLPLGAFATTSAQEALQRWTQLEAVLKAAGLDLAVPFAARLVRAADRHNAPSLFRLEGHPGRWRTLALGVPGPFTATLALGEARTVTRSAAR